MAIFNFESIFLRNTLIFSGVNSISLTTLYKFSLFRYSSSHRFSQNSKSTSKMSTLAKKGNRPLATKQSSCKISWIALRNKIDKFIVLCIKNNTKNCQKFTKRPPSHFLAEICRNVCWNTSAAKPSRYTLWNLVRGRNILRQQLRNGSSNYRLFWEWLVAIGLSCT